MTVEWDTRPEEWAYAKHSILSYAIKDVILSLVGSGEFSCMDLACGQGFIINFIATEFPASICTGLDIREFDTWEHFSKVTFIKQDIEKYIETDTPTDVLIMTDTYRGSRWDELDDWIRRNATWFITDYYKGKEPIFKNKYICEFQAKPFKSIFDLYLCYPKEEIK